MTAAALITSDRLSRTRGIKLRLPKWTMAHSCTANWGELRIPLTRAQTITVHHSSPIRVCTWAGDRDAIPGMILLPTVTWAGTGGYWKTAQITPEVAEANGITLDMPQLTESDYRRLDHLFGVKRDDISLGFTDEWTVK